MKLINRLLQFVLLPIIIAGAFFVWSLPRITTDYNFNADELIYLSRSNYWTAFKTGDFNNPIWKDDSVIYDQPQLTNYIYSEIPGDKSLINPDKSPCTTSNKDDFFQTWSCLDGKPLNSWPTSLSGLKSLVINGRILGTAISSLAITSTYFLGLILAGPLAGIISTIYLGYFSYFQSLSTMIMEDQTLLVFLNLQLILAVLIARSNRSKLFSFILLGLVTGLAFSTKLSAAIPTLVTFSYLAIQSILKKQIKITHFLISIMIACGVFLSLHPFLWSNPLGGFIRMVTWRTTQIASQISPVYVPTDMTDKVVYSMKEGFSSWKSGDELATVITLSTLALISLITLFKTNSSFALISGINMAIFILVLPLKWNRYLLPIMPAIAIYLGNLPNVVYAIVKKIKENFINIKQFLTGASVAGILIMLFAFLPITNWLSFIVLTITLLLIAQGYFVTRAMLYSFSHRKSPTISIQEQTNTFSLIVPARDESSVIGHTIHSLANLNYNHNLYEVMVIIRADDHSTIHAAEEAISQCKSNNIHIVQIDGEAHNKAYSLNIGLHLAKYNIIGIFDAEDEPHKDILQKVNDYLTVNKNVGAVQAPVHLTNINSSWYASLNAIEYYYWFASVLPYLATKHIVPLGGNTIFTKREVFGTVGNYDEVCLTEDADLGIRLAENNVKIGVIDDASIATTEEAPTSEIDVIRQRSRWDQGYFQILDKSNWQNLNTTQKLYALYTLTQPLFRHLSFLNMIFAPLIASFGHIPLWIVIFSFVPGYFLILQLGLYMLGLAELAKLHNIKVTLWRYILTLLAFVPYQALLTLATLRALSKIALSNYSWDKTEHTNSHRSGLAILEG